ncbi:uncharacterized protein LOC133361853 isoform X2 [Lethenteron reissneri]|uniref:uncharacterized protein LOC133361853 isoform X2 n=1 Tax=Lethenteron reissneri TaxID=7753 RepID=UPI002AB733DC|nr:uncharacterized protein LOC133361853 isoform X2 [Lethenteron reissneri]
MATLLVTLLVLVLALVCTVRNRRSPGNRPAMEQPATAPSLLPDSPGSHHHHCDHRHHHHYDHHHHHGGGGGGAEMATLESCPRPWLALPDESRSPSRLRTNPFTSCRVTVRWPRDSDHLAWHARRAGFQLEP